MQVMVSHELPCPVCRAAILVDPVALLHGDKAACGSCGTALALEPGEGMRSAIEQFDSARQEVRKVARQMQPRRRGQAGGQ